MSETKQPLDLSVLQNDYEIVGEVSGARDARTFMATRKDADTKRRDDDSGVSISVVTTPAGDEGNALSHLAADTKMLAGSTHRRLVPVIEGRWIGDDAFAVVTQRTTDPSLAQKLAVGETFPTTRVAAILREVNGLLEWAREHKFVHRSITSDRIFFEPKTDRVRVLFGVAPIRRIQQADAPTEDARTIVKLAMAMLTGSDDAGAYNGQTLAELRPDLPERLREATAELLDDKKAHDSADVSAYLTLIGMADQLSAGEKEVARLRAEVLEEQRVEREKIAAERAVLERVMAEERAAFERLRENERDKLERQRAEDNQGVERLKAEEREKARKETAELQRPVKAERAALAAGRAELVAKRESFERAMGEQRDAIERVAAEDRRRVDALRAEIKAAGEIELEKMRQAAVESIPDAESVLDQAEFATPVFIPPVNVPLEELIFHDDVALVSNDESVVEPEHGAKTPLQASGDPSKVVRGAWLTRKKWVVPAMLTGLMAAIVVTLLTLGTRQTMTQREVAPGSRPAAKPARPVIAHAPVVAPPTSIVPLPPPAIMDSASGSVARSLDSAGTVTAVVKRKPKKIVLAVPAPDSTTSADSLPQFRDASPKKREPRATKDIIVHPDTMLKSPDTLAKKDSLVRRDTLLKRPDTLVKMDSQVPSNARSLVRPDTSQI